jgi:dTDP-4-dehydrorhamnose 3,5-epimerase
MRFNPTSFPDVWLIELEPASDNRGFFARTFCVEEFAARALETSYLQHSVSFSSRKGTVRGMHYQREPHGEVKLVRCISGAIWDVVVDIRPESVTYLSWQGFELSSANRYQLYIPQGFAHGFQTLTDNVEVNYLISEPYSPQCATGIRYNDPLFGITWPLPVSEMSAKDMQWADFTVGSGVAS